MITLSFFMINFLIVLAVLVAIVAFVMAIAAIDEKYGTEIGAIIVIGIYGITMISVIAFLLALIRS